MLVDYSWFYTDEYVCSVKWVGEGAHLAVGSSTGEVQLWDATAMKRSRTMMGLESRVASLSWNQWVLSGGSRAGQIQHSDVRVADHQVGLVTLKYDLTELSPGWSGQRSRTGGLRVSLVT